MAAETPIQTLVNPVALDVSGWTTTAWTTFTLPSTGRPTDTVGFILRVTGSYTIEVRARKKGSTDDGPLNDVGGDFAAQAFIGVDGSFQFEVKKNTAAAAVALDVLGYFVAGSAAPKAVFLTNYVNKANSSNVTWQTCDITANVGADAGNIGAAIMACSTTQTKGAAVTQGIRPYGDDHAADMMIGYTMTFWTIVKVDASDRFETYSNANTAVTWWLVGYITVGSSLAMVASPNDSPLTVTLDGAIHSLDIASAVGATHAKSALVYINVTSGIMAWGGSFFDPASSDPLYTVQHSSAVMFIVNIGSDMIVNYFFSNACTDTTAEVWGYTEGMSLVPGGVALSGGRGSPVLAAAVTGATKASGLVAPSPTTVGVSVPTAIAVTGTHGSPTTVGVAVPTAIAVTGTRGSPTTVGVSVPTAIAVTGTRGSPTTVGVSVPTAIAVTGTHGSPTTVGVAVPTAIAVTGTRGSPTTVGVSVPTAIAVTGTRGSPTTVGVAVPTAIAVTGTRGSPTTVGVVASGTISESVGPTLHEVIAVLVAAGVDETIAWGLAGLAVLVSADAVSAALTLAVLGSAALPAAGDVSAAIATLLTVLAEPVATPAPADGSPSVIGASLTPGGSAGGPAAALIAALSAAISASTDTPLITLYPAAVSALQSVLQSVLQPVLARASAASGAAEGQPLDVSASLVGGTPADGFTAAPSAPLSALAGSPVPTALSTSLGALGASLEVLLALFGTTAPAHAPAATGTVRVSSEPAGTTQLPTAAASSRAAVQSLLSSLLARAAVASGVVDGALLGTAITPASGALAPGFMDVPHAPISALPGSPIPTALSAALGALGGSLAALPGSPIPTALSVALGALGGSLAALLALVGSTAPGHAPVPTGTIGVSGNPAGTMQLPTAAPVQFAPLSISAEASAPHGVPLKMPVGALALALALATQALTPAPGTIGVPVRVIGLGAGGVIAFRKLTYDFIIASDPELGVAQAWSVEFSVPRLSDASVAQPLTGLVNCTSIGVARVINARLTSARGYR